MLRGRLVVAKVGRAPFPDEPRPCAFLLALAVSRSGGLEHDDLAEVVRVGDAEVAEE